MIQFTVEAWEQGKIVETVATANNGLVARAAFKALVELLPRATLMLRHGTRVVEQWEPSGDGNAR